MFFESLRKLYGGFCSKNCKNCTISIWNCTKIVQKSDDFFHKDSLVQFKAAQTDSN